MHLKHRNMVEHLCVQNIYIHSQTIIGLLMHSQTLYNNSMVPWGPGSIDETTTFLKP